MAEVGSGGVRGRKKNVLIDQVETGAEIREAIELIRLRTQEGKADVCWIEETLRSAALGHVARLLGLFYSHELPTLLGLDVSGDGHGRRTRSTLSSVGPVTYTRAYTAAVGQDGQTLRRFPLDEVLGITEGCTPAMAAMVSWAGASFDSYDQAGEALLRLAGVSVPGRRVQRIVNALAERESTWIATREHEPTSGGILNLQVDMTGIRMRPEELVGVKGKDGAPKKCQVKVAAVFKQQTNAKGEIQRIPDSTTRVISFEDVNTFSRMLMNEACRRGYHQADTVVFTSDGAEWIWRMVEARFSKAVQIVDFYHAAEHLAALCDIVEVDKAKAQVLFNKRRKILLNWGVESLIGFFTKIAVGHPKEAQIKNALGYFISHRDRMKYREFRVKGYFIGSGVIEGSCKCLVNQRTDLGGQRWLKTGSLNVLRIRAAIQDKLHDKYWKTIGKLISKAA